LELVEEYVRHTHRWIVTSLSLFLFRSHHFLPTSSILLHNFYLQNHLHRMNIFRHLRRSPAPSSLFLPYSAPRHHRLPVNLGLMSSGRHLSQVAPPVDAIDNGLIITNSCVKVNYVQVFADELGALIIFCFSF
jgi:hypothetical protein